MNLPEPSQSSFDVQGRLCGIPLRIHPLFWVSVTVLGIRYFADPDAGNLAYFTFWIAAVLGSVLISASGQVLVGRLLGMRGGIVLYGLGSLILGVDSLHRCWQRAVVLLAGPLIQFLLVCGVWGFTEITPFPETLSDWDWQTPIATGAVILVRINLYWGLLNILPLWPLTGGRIATDVGETLAGKKGQIAALVLSLGTTAVLSVWVIIEMSVQLSFPYDPRYLIRLEEGILLLLFCFVLWLRSFKALWPETTSGQEPI